jgi:glycosyltransferase involved in cell wall biosynthesis
MSDLFQAAGIQALFPLLPCHAPGVPLVFWVTDLQYRHHPEHYPESRLRWFEDFNARNGELAERVIVASEAVLADVGHFLPSVRHKARLIRVCSVPTPTWWRADPMAVAQRYRLPERFFMISNQFCVHKNHLTIFDAVKALRDRGITVNLACTGRIEDYRDPRFFPALRDRISRDGLDVQVRILGAVARHEQIALLRRSLGLIQPSLFEGWGLAIADAKALGKAVVASDLPVHHEHAHPRITFVPPSDVEAWAEALQVANAELVPGPDRSAEEAAARHTRMEAEMVGRSAASIFREVMAGPDMIPGNPGRP